MRMLPNAHTTVVRTANKRRVRAWRNGARGRARPWEQRSTAAAYSRETIEPGGWQHSRWGHSHAPAARPPDTQWPGGAASRPHAGATTPAFALPAQLT